MNLTLVAHDIRSTHNVGAFFRTCDGLGVEKIIFSGYTPYPTFEGDTRLPHFFSKITRQIHKTALGAESTVNFEHFSDLNAVLKFLKSKKYVCVALEQFPSSISLVKCRQTLNSDYKGRKVALFVGNEIHGVKDEILKQMDIITEIPMRGVKESLNVSVATAIALYELCKK